MNWKQSLDRYLTTEPNDGFMDWAEMVDDSFDSDFFDNNEIWLTDSDQSNKWYWKLYGKEYNPKQAARIIERAFNICGSKIK